VFALEPDLAWPEWILVVKTMTLLGVILVATNTKKEVELLVAVICLSIGFYGLKGGIFTILTGGNSHVLGPEGSYIQDNNGLALALITIIPLLWYLQLTASNRLIRYVLIGLLVFTAIGAVGSYSRGAMLGGVAMFAYLGLKSKYKFQIIVLLLIITPLILEFMPQQWFDRMTSMNNYQQDPRHWVA
jgi:probable O-glycosylation ligase (exosortase A-associated)